MTDDKKLPDILCIGAVLWDIVGRAPVDMRVGTDVGGRILRVPGGVALNIAMMLRRFDLTPALLSAVGLDREGEELLQACLARGLLTQHIYRSGALPTDAYMAIEGANGLIAAIADAHSLEKAGESILHPLSDGRLGTLDAPWSGLIALDGNLTVELLTKVATDPAFSRADLRIAPASPGKAERLRPLLAHPNATIYVNLEEAGLLCETTFDRARDGAEALMSLGAHRVLVTDGANATAKGTSQGLFEAVPPSVRVKRITGAGDTFMAGHIAAECAGDPPAQALNRALQAAAAYVSGETDL